MELIIRMLGGGLLLIGSLGCGLSCAWGRKKCLYAMQQIVTQISQMQSEVRFGQYDLVQTCRQVGERFGGVFAEGLKRVAERMELNNGCSFYEIWQEEMERALSGEPLPEAFERELLEVGKRCGGADLLQQQRIWEQTALRLGQLEEQYRLCMENQNKVSVCLSVTAGTVLCILLL